MTNNKMSQAISNKFLFIIPLTPDSHLTPDRKKLRHLCFTTLLHQTYPFWEALLIGSSKAELKNDERFIHLDFEGQKEEKLQKASEYILNSPIDADYIIRLDDDDIFNPGLLEKLSLKKFDLYVDKFHSFWNFSTGSISQKMMYWFPNTCIHKREHALSFFGSFPPGNYVRFKVNPFLIENEHNDFHLYYNQSHEIIFSSKNCPVYLRTINSDSITAIQAANRSEYMNRFGYWKINRLKPFLFLNNFELEMIPDQKDKQDFIFLIKSIKNSWLSRINYNKIVIKKDGI